jgi:hypothetical protein
VMHAWLDLLISESSAVCTHEKVRLVLHELAQHSSSPIIIIFYFACKS